MLYTHTHTHTHTHTYIDAYIYLYMNADDGDTHICMHINIGAYALFLEEKCKDYGAAAEMYLRAVRAGSVFTTVFTTVFTILITTVLTTGFFFLLST
jgi:hypothetical protein